MFSDLLRIVCDVLHVMSRSAACFGFVCNNRADCLCICSSVHKQKCRVVCTVMSCWVLCLFMEVQTSNDASFLYHKLFLIWSYSTSLLFIQSIIVALSVFYEFLSLPFCLLRLYAEGIYFSTHDLTIFSVFVGWCSSSFCFHPPCPKPIDWIGVQSNWFSLTFSKFTFQRIPVIECPPS